MPLAHSLVFTHTLLLAALCRSPIASCSHTLFYRLPCVARPLPRVHTHAYLGCLVSLALILVLRHTLALAALCRSLIASRLHTLFYRLCVARPSPRAHTHPFIGCLVSLAHGLVFTHTLLSAALCRSPIASCSHLSRLPCVARPYPRVEIHACTGCLVPLAHSLVLLVFAHTLLSADLCRSPVASCSRTLLCRLPCVARP